MSLPLSTNTELMEGKKNEKNEQREEVEWEKKEEAKEETVFLF